MELGVSDDGAADAILSDGSVLMAASEPIPTNDSESGG
jgi:hypothetical protein